MLAFPRGTSTASAIASKATAGISSYAASIYKDFIEYTDTVNNLTPRVVSPAAFAVAQYATTSPETSPANRRVALITGTERTGASQNIPYTSTELNVLEQAGVNLFTNPVPGGAFFAIRHNKNSFNADPSRFNIAYSRMTQFLAQSFNTFLIGQFIGQAQSTRANDPLREKIRAAYNDFITRLVANGQVDSFSVQCDLRNNPVSQISAGLLRCDIVVAYLSIVDRIVISLTGGQTVKVTVNPTQLTAQS